MFSRIIEQSKKQGIEVLCNGLEIIVPFSRIKEFLEICRDNQVVVGSLEGWDSEDGGGPGDSLMGVVSEIEPSYLISERSKDFSTSDVSFKWAQSVLSAVPWKDRDDIKFVSVMFLDENFSWVEFKER